MKNCPRLPHFSLRPIKSDRLLAEQVLCTGASVDDAEELLFGWQLPGDLPVTYACLTGGVAYATSQD